MFPEIFVEAQLYRFTEPHAIVFDPFCGRGTTVFESLLRNRCGYGLDINPVAACVSATKADPPELPEVFKRLDDLECGFAAKGPRNVPSSEFFQWCFQDETRRQVAYLREELDWRQDKCDRFIAAVALGCLHGESHKTRNCFSNRMPRTISTKPAYSVRWWKERGLEPPRRDAFEILRDMSGFRLSGARPQRTGQVKEGDARNASGLFPDLGGRIDLVVTSPPYFDTTDYGEDQWLRLWFLGGNERPMLRLNRDDRHESVDRYWAFLSQAWTGVAPLLGKRSTIVVRIGGRRLSKEELCRGLMETISMGLVGRNVAIIDKGHTTEIRNRQTNAFRPGTTPRRYEHDFIFRVDGSPNG